MSHDNTHRDRITSRMQLTREEFETVLNALEADATERLHEDAQDILQLRAPRPWLEQLDAEQNAARG